MYNIEIIQQRLSALKPHLKVKYNVDELGIFGSYSRGEADEKSDVDLLVSFSKPIGWEFFDLEEELEKELGMKIDLVTKNALKQQIKNKILSEVRYV